MTTPKNTTGELSILFSRKRDDWETPKELFNQLNSEFHFVMDVAASQSNKKCSEWIGEAENALASASIWSLVNWCNPPYSKTKEFVEKAYSESLNGKLSVLLLPARTDTRVFHTYIYNKPNVEVRFIKGRVKFVHPDGKLLRGTKMNGSNDAAPFPSMIVIFNPL